VSIIVAVKKHGEIVIASDSAQTEDGMIVSADFYANNNKIVACGESYIGLVGWSCTQDIIESLVRDHANKIKLANRAQIFDTFRFIHARLKEDYYIETSEDKDQPVESSQIGALIIGPGGIYEIESYRTVTEYTRFWALGSGKKLALGALQASYDSVEKAEDIATIAVKAACAFDDACAEPMHLHCITIN
jgi:ATP-dependent protease HslVU (ClpYQ) peptidase subunit